MINFEFVKEVPASTKNYNVYAEERNVIQQLLESKEIAVRLSYPIAKKVILAKSAIKRWFSQRKISNLNMVQRGCDLFVFKTN